MNELIEDYQRKINTINELLKDSSNSEDTINRLKIKVGCYRNFLTDLNRTLNIDIVSKCDCSFFVALVYQNTEATMLRTLVTKTKNKDEALGKAIEYFAEETKGYGLVMKTVTSPNEG